MKELIVKRLQHSPAPIKPPCSAKYLELASWERPLKPIYWMQPVVLLLLHPLCFMGSRITAFSQLFIQLQPRSNDLQVQVAPDSLLACSRNSKLFAAWLADEMKEEELRLKFAQLPRRYPLKCSHRQYLQSWLVTKTVSLVWYCQLFSHPQRFPLRGIWYSWNLAPWCLLAVLPPGRIQAAGGIRRACLGKRRVLLHHKLSLPRRIKHMWDHPTGMPEPKNENSYRSSKWCHPASTMQSKRSASTWIQMDEAEKAESPFLDLTMESKDEIGVVRLKMDLDNYFGSSGKDWNRLRELRRAFLMWRRCIDQYCWYGTGTSDLILISTIATCFDLSFNCLTQIVGETRGIFKTASREATVMQKKEKRVKMTKWRSRRGWTVDDGGGAL